MAMCEDIGRQRNEWLTKALHESQQPPTPEPQPLLKGARSPPSRPSPKCIVEEDSQDHATSDEAAAKPSQGLINSGEGHKEEVSHWHVDAGGHQEPYVNRQAWGKGKGMGRGDRSLPSANLKHPPVLRRS